MFVNIPKTGYVGVGVVKGPSVPAREFRVTVDGKEMPIVEAPLEVSGMGEDADDDERCEYCVSVEWIKAVTREQAYWERWVCTSLNHPQPVVVR